MSKKSKKRSRQETTEENEPKAAAAGAAEEDGKREKKDKKKKKRKKKDKESMDKEDAVVISSDASSTSLAPEPKSEEPELRPKKKQKKDKKKKKKREKEAENQQEDSDDHESSKTKQDPTAEAAADDDNEPIISLLLFYQYIEPNWDEPTYQNVLSHLQELGTELKLSGRMRVAREGLNCTLTGPPEGIDGYCAHLRSWRPQDFHATEFKITRKLPRKQAFPNLKVFPVVELVHYGLDGAKAPPLTKYSGVHLEPEDYHEKLAQDNTVVIDVRNHYEAAIGHFVPKQGEWLDPKMRKSTEFPVWLDKKETKEQMKGKQVLMYCTGGIRCERASALLKYKMETDPEMKDLGIQGVYQLQGGIDKYFKKFPDGGHWQGKNYVFDKRFAHAPDEKQKKGQEKVSLTVDPGKDEKKQAEDVIMGRCEACRKPWDRYRGKRRCPTCGVPSLVCRDCFLADQNGTKPLGKEVRCDLCVEQQIASKREWRSRDEQEIADYERKQRELGLLEPSAAATLMAPNPNGVTRLYIKNMCRKNMDESALIETLAPSTITHIVWRNDRKTQQFLGQAWIEMASADDAARAVGQSGKAKAFGRPLYISFDPPGGKDAWPPSSSKL